VNGDTGDVACDHYHLYRDDVKADGGAGAQGVPFFDLVARLFPSGSGALNQAGSISTADWWTELLAAGIVPMPTLYHWDLRRHCKMRVGGPTWRRRSGSRITRRRRFAGWGIG